MSNLNEHGAWLPWPLVEKVAKLRLRPASRWQVFIFILAKSCRFGGKEARLSVKEISAATGLSVRTVKSALAGLIADGHVRRQGRYRKLIVTLLTAADPHVEEVELRIPAEQ